MDLIPGPGTTVPHAAGAVPKIKKQKTKKQLRGGESVKIKQGQQAGSTAVGVRSGPTLDLSYWQSCWSLEIEGKAVMRQEVSGLKRL